MALTFDLVVPKLGNVTWIAYLIYVPNLKLIVFTFMKYRAI